VELAKQNASKAKALARSLNKLEGFKAPKFAGHHFNEFVLECPTDVDALNDQLYQRGIQGGLNLKTHIPDLGNAVLITVTENHTEDDLKRLTTAIESIISEGGGTK
jgi:glycine dehydrogenase subunit 1